MLYNNLKHIETELDFERITALNAKVVIICGNMNAESVKLFETAEELETETGFHSVFDIEFDNPSLQSIRNIAVNKQITNLPFVIIYNKGKLTHVLKNDITKTQLLTIFKQEAIKQTN